MGPTLNLINETHNFCERRKYTFNVLLEYNIITHEEECVGIKDLSHEDRWQFMVYEMSYRGNKTKYQ